MAVEKIIGLVDRTGVRRNVTDLMDELEHGNLEAVVICFKRKDDGSIRTFWNGGNDTAFFLLKLAQDDLMENHREIAVSQGYEDLE